ncbi:hypothetical protein B0H65DRAFT_457290 [Neurospora tetraspora]|uniref:Uncharacterized protein n=1 Tax=Neurospora tetraspora TaxID=94610 RepID=A0AAE0JKX5_9PEZI|nr:hypothetical protein B0H65DRAFT_457290 [Neurospora tetraspora]
MRSYFAVSFSILLFVPEYQSMNLGFCKIVRISSFGLNLLVNSNLPSLTAQLQDRGTILYQMNKVRERPSLIHSGQN